MAKPSTGDITCLLKAWNQGEEVALEKLMPLVYNELRRLAHRYMVRERKGHTLETGALVNEAYVRLIDANEVHWKDRAHFFAISAQLMRRILVDFARKRAYKKRGGEVRKVPLDEARLQAPKLGADLLRLDDALCELAEIDARKAKVVELRFFGGLAVEETAEVLNVSADTVMRDWRLAKAWLVRELKRT